MEEVICIVELSGWYAMGYDVEAGFEYDDNTLTDDPVYKYKPARVIFTKKLKEEN